MTNDHLDSGKLGTIWSIEWETRKCLCTKDQLLINNATLENCRKRRRNLSKPGWNIKTY